MSKQGLFNYGQDIVMAFSLPVVGCLVKKGLPLLRVGTQSVFSSVT